MANNVTVGSGCRLRKGCILSFNVVLDDNVDLEQYTKITLHRLESDGWGNDDDFGFDSDDNNVVMLPQQTTSLRTSPAERVLSAENVRDDQDRSSSIMDIMESGGVAVDPDDDAKGSLQYDTHIVGAKGKGFLYEIKSGDDSYVLESMNNVLSSNKDRPPRGYSVSDLDTKQQPDEPVDAPISTQNGHMMEELENESMDRPDDGGGGGGDLSKLVSEIAECVESAEGNASTDMDNVVFEISTSVRLANHASLEDFSCAVFMALLRRIGDEKSYQEKKDGVGRLTEKYSCLFERLARREEDQQTVIAGLMRACALREMGLIYFFLEALDKLYYEDIVSLEAIQQWNAGRDKAITAAMATGSKFEQYLAMSIEGWVEAEEGSSGSEEESS